MQAYSKQDIKYGLKEQQPPPPHFFYIRKPNAHEFMKTFLMRVL